MKKPHEIKNNLLKKYDMNPLWIPSQIVVYQGWKLETLIFPMLL